jgi:hypothetical protein
VGATEVRDELRERESSRRAPIYDGIVQCARVMRLPR